MTVTAAQRNVIREMARQMECADGNHAYCDADNCSETREAYEIESALDEDFDMWSDRSE